MAIRPKAVIESRNGEKFSPITIAKNVLTDDGQNLHDILSDRKEDMMTPTIENSSSMFKVGQGDNVDYSENVVDGAYESLVFKGKSLVNLLTSFRPDTDSAWVRNGSSFTLNASGVLFLNYAALLKPNTTYTVVGELDFDVDGIIIGFREGNKPWEVNRSIGSRGRFAVLISTSAESTSNALTVHRAVTSNSDRITLSNLMVLEGDWTNKELPPYFEGICDCKSPILSNVGKNLFTTNNMRTGNIAGNSSVVEGNDIGGNWQVTDYIPVKPLIEYYHSTSLYKFEKASFYDINKKIIYGTGVNHFKTRVISTPHQCAYVRYVVMKDSSTNNSLSLEELVSNNDIVVAQGSSNIAYEPYKSNILSCNGDKIELTEDMFEQGNVGGSDKVGSTYEETKITNDSRIRLSSLLSVKPNTTYHMSCDSNYKMGVRLFDVNGLFTGEYHEWYDDFAFTTNSNTKYVTIKMKKNDNATITPTIISEAQPELREVDKTIVLRSLPNGVCDTLNVETGEYVQRIKQIVLDGSENWSMDTNGGGATRFYNNMCTDMGIKHGTISSNENLICDKFSHPTTNIWIDTNESIQVVLPNGLYFIFNNAQSVIQWKEYLQSNPITVQYQLAEPIIKTVDLSGYPFSYENGHVILSSGSIEQSLTPKVEYSVAINRNGQIRNNQKMVERHQKQLDRLQAMILTNLVNTQYEQALTNLKYDLKNVREEVK